MFTGKLAYFESERWDKRF